MNVQKSKAMVWRANHDVLRKHQHFANARLRMLAGVRSGETRSVVSIHPTFGGMRSVASLLRGTTERDHP
ncbi:MAG: hypothetical protein NZ749_13380, partial [bacterium]|nr:hypothetical protein [bacterium]